MIKDFKPNLINLHQGKLAQKIIQNLSSLVNFQVTLEEITCWFLEFLWIKALVKMI